LAKAGHTTPKRISLLRPRRLQKKKNKKKPSGTHQDGFLLITQIFYIRNRTFFSKSVNFTTS